MINIVLVEPEIPQNTGNVARSCACTGAGLHLVEPLGFEIDDKKMKRAGLDYWDKLGVTVYPSLADFLEKTKGAPRYFLSTKGKKVYSDVTFPDGCYIIFGKETAGLPEPLLKEHPDETLRIPMRPTLRSLNISNSVAIVLYEALRQQNFSSLELEGEPRSFKWSKNTYII